MMMPFLIIAGFAAALVLVLFFTGSRKIKLNRKNQTSSEEEKKQMIAKLRSHVSLLEESLAKTKDIYASVQGKQKEFRDKNAQLQHELLAQKEIYSALAQEHELLKKEKEIFLNRISRMEKERQELHSYHSTQEEGLAIQLQNFESQLKQLHQRQKTYDAAVAQYRQTEETLKEKIKLLEKESLAQRAVIESYKKKQESPANTAPQKNHTDSTIASTLFPPTSNVGEILVKERLITKDALLKAKEYQVNFGGNIIQYLIANQHLSEERLAQWLITNPKVPYVPVNGYGISKEVIDLIPYDIAQQYWLIPVEKIENVLIIAMVDPLNAKAIRAVEEMTGCTVQVYLGLFSEIETAIQYYYKIPFKDTESKGQFPFLIDTATYHGAERRQSIRLHSRLDVSFAENGSFRKSMTYDVSRGGFSLACGKALPVGSLLTLQVNLPKELSPLPIATVVQVIRSSPAKNNQFAVGVKTLKISPQELNAIMKYAATHLVQN